MKYSLIVLFLYSSLTWAQSVLEDQDLIKNTGLLTTYYSEKDDKIYLEVIHLDSSFIYVSSLSQGVGNNDLMLDRGQLGGTRVVKFKKAGNKLLLIQQNLKYRAITANKWEKKSVQEAFAKSVLFGFKILEQTEKGFLIDLTPFLLQDTHGVSEVLKSKNQGTYNLDLTRCALNMERTRNFPKNVEFDVIITLKGNAQGNEIRSVSPNSKFVTVYQHHSFVELPDNGFKLRRAHPNSGTITTDYMNYSSPIGESMKVSYCIRHRLEKKNPKAESSEAKEPIIYYLDNGTPEPIRSALLDGASWWDEAFREIGYIDAFQVKILPDSIDPLDVRYNVIQWVHRSTRGWSYGGAVVDPRTGEIIKGHVSLGSLRVRQDYKIAKALSNNSSETQLTEFALSRIRQLGAHEVGHTLGFAHNFAASLNNRASVMDYPHPLVRVKEGKIDLSNAYDLGIGEWDKVTVAYAYSEFAANEEIELKRILKNALNSGLRYVSDSDSRPLGSSNAFGHLWDNGSNPIDELQNVLLVRQVAIDQFDAEAVADGESFADLEDLFVLLYYYHRYQSEAVVKLIGGREYGYSLKGETEIPSKPVNSNEQRRALDALLQTLKVEILMIPEDKLKLFPDRGPWRGRDRESFATRTGSTFDPLSVAQTASEFLLVRLLHPERVNRLISQSMVDSDQLNLVETLNKLIQSSLKSSPKGEYQTEIQNIVNHTVLTKLMSMSQSKLIYPQARAITIDKLREHKEYLEELQKPTVFQKEMIQEIKVFFDNPKNISFVEPMEMPDGSPIGTFSCSH